MAYILNPKKYLEHKGGTKILDQIKKAGKYTTTYEKLHRSPGEFPDAVTVYAVRDYVGNSVKTAQKFENLEAFQNYILNLVAGSGEIKLPIHTGRQAKDRSLAVYDNPESTLFVVAIVDAMSEPIFSSGYQTEFRPVITEEIAGCFDALQQKLDDLQEEAQRKAETRLTKKSEKKNNPSDVVAENVEQEEESEEER